MSNVTKNNKSIQNTLRNSYETENIRQMYTNRNMPIYNPIYENNKSREVSFTLRSKSEITLPKILLNETNHIKSLPRLNPKIPNFKKTINSD